MTDEFDCFVFCSVMLHCYHMLSSCRFLSHTFQSIFRSGRNTRGYAFHNVLNYQIIFCTVVFSCNHSAFISERIKYDYYIGLIIILSPWSSSLTVSVCLYFYAFQTLCPPLLYQHFLMEIMPDHNY